LGHENAENPNAARFQHLLGTLSISFGIPIERASGALEDVARSRYSQTAGAPLA